MKFISACTNFVAAIHWNWATIKRWWLNNVQSLVFNKWSDTIQSLPSVFLLMHSIPYYFQHFIVRHKIFSGPDHSASRCPYSQMMLICNNLSILHDEHNDDRTAILRVIYLLQAGAVHTCTFFQMDREGVVGIKSQWNPVFW